MFWSIFLPWFSMPPKWIQFILFHTACQGYPVLPQKGAHNTFLKEKYTWRVYGSMRVLCSQSCISTGETRRNEHNDTNIAARLGLGFFLYWPPMGQSSGNWWFGDGDGQSRVSQLPDCFYAAYHLDHSFQFCHAPLLFMRIKRSSQEEMESLSTEIHDLLQKQAIETVIR